MVSGIVALFGRVIAAVAGARSVKAAVTLTEILTVAVLPVVRPVSVAVIVTS